jgi:periplasmic divalent cation tolerance protein
LIISTFPNEFDAKKVIKILLNERIIACANILPSISLYWWNGSIQEETEVIVFFKTRKELEEQVMKRIQGLHSYHVPAIYTIDSNKLISKNYSTWIDEVTKTS